MGREVGRELGFVRVIAEGALNAPNSKDVSILDLKSVEGRGSRGNHQEGPEGSWRLQVVLGAKHSPRRFRYGGPEELFRLFQHKKVIFRFFGIGGVDNPIRKSHAKHVPIEYLSSSKKRFICEKLKNRLSRWCPKFFLVMKNLMFVIKSFFADFRHSKLNFERNRDQESA